MPSGTVVYVYPDLVFIISFFMNFVILLGTNRLTRLNQRKWRLGLGAVFGAFYSAAAAIPHLAFLHSFWIKVFFGFGMFFTAFCPLSLKKLISGILYFYLVSFSIGGIFFGVIFFLNSSPWGMQLKHGILTVINTYFVTGLAITLILCYAIYKWGIPLFRKSGLFGVIRVPVKVFFDDQEIEVDALLDTGNQLQDPLSMTPVIVIEYNALCRCLPVEIKKFFEEKERDLACLTGILNDKFWSARFRIIPFTSLGKSNGMLIGFRPDQIQVRRGGKVFTKKDVIIGIYNKKLSPEGSYEALLHPDLLQEISA